MSINCYPSTSDRPIIAGGQDLQLSILEDARDRYARYGTSGTYLERDGTVCAVGAVLASAGVDPDAWDAAYGNFEKYGTGPSESDAAIAYALDAYANVEESVVKATQKAMKRLDKAAAKLFPESVEGAVEHNWLGPLEWVNESREFFSDASRRSAILDCYDEAIRTRRRKLARKALRA